MKQGSGVQQVQFFLRRIGQEWWGMEPGVLPVPFITHSANQAASAALAMVLRYYGRPFPNRQITDELQSAQWLDCNMPRVLATTAQDCGMDAGITAGNLNRLKEWLLQGVPVLVFPEGEIRGEGEPVAVVTGLTRDCTAACLHYGPNPHSWLRLPDFLALCGGETFTAVPVAECHLATHAQTRHRAGQARKSWLNLLPNPVSAMAA